MKKSFFRPATALLLALIIAIVPVSTSFATTSGIIPPAMLTPSDALTGSDALTETDAPSTETDAPLTETDAPSTETDAPIIPEQPDEPYQPETPDIPSNPDAPEEPDTPSVPVEPQNGDVVGTISLSFRMSRISFGHVWIYIHNTTDQPLEVGLYTVQPGEGVSLGNFNLTRSDGPGLYYNVESYCGEKYGLDGTVTVSDELTWGRLKAVSTILKNGNYFGVFYNCTGFALTIWNVGSGKPMLPIPVPLVALLQIILYGGKFNNLEMYCPPAEQVYKQKGNGSKAYLVSVSEGSLDSAI